MLNVDLNNPADVRNAGMKALREALGPVGMVKLSSNLILVTETIQKKNMRDQILVWTRLMQY